MKELEMTILLRNNLLKERRQSLGFSQAKLARAIGMPLESYTALETMRKPPVCKYGWTKAARHIAAFYEVAPEVLFPDAITEIRTNKVTRKANAADVRELLMPDRGAVGPAEEYERKELRTAVGRALGTLTRRQAFVLCERFGLNEDARERTYDELAEEMGVSRSRVCQIETGAIRKLRHPSRTKYLQPFHGEEPTR